MPTGKSAVQRDVVRLVLDTNVVTSGLMWQGSTARLFDLVAGGPFEVELIASEPLLEELRNIAGRRKFSKRLSLMSTSMEEFVADYARRTRLVVPTPIPPTVLQDPDDDVVLATALAGAVHLIVTGDAAVLRLRRFRSMLIVRPAVAIAMLGGPPIKRRRRRNSPPKGGSPPAVL